ncbi:hypothetical protein DPEC_G00238980 [Dallia pectoralis]|uniref:Uncharacterized protein n=1 Tax=Dallia pectoralis TaxID=75939 RepID=A0ACC2FYT7_DALPE|nr:hypothetical protein DPEC_G00238980 [Dallia pectoralis]
MGIVLVSMYGLKVIQFKQEVRTGTYCRDSNTRTKRRTHTQFLSSRVHLDAPHPTDIVPASLPTPQAPFITQASPLSSQPIRISATPVPTHSCSLLPAVFPAQLVSQLSG